ncbi:hypothetical protein F511_05713 [Dorcoceras hygrometricum]|uniref:TF-B3 domain-containing protein n=1 Tax=Dorcoceras hygrometricum TaxID=472368 RepID=A0A2Z7B8M8_9LAMI|nr:hypothetical protein F511_05713 [Dorcoceras hygrometricum]
MVEDEDNNPSSVSSGDSTTSLKTIMLLLLGSKLEIVDHIGEFNPERGVEIDVYDVDTEMTHTLVLKRWKTNSYVLNNGRTKDFVKRMVLKKNDKIGLRWEEHDRRLELTIIKRAPISTINFFYNWFMQETI